MTISRDSRTMRENSQGGALPPCKGRDAYPVGRDITSLFLAGLPRRGRRAFERCQQLADDVVQRAAAADPSHDGDDVVLPIDIDNVGAVAFEIGRASCRERV